jgi:hypothetical protein
VDAQTTFTLEITVGMRKLSRKTASNLQCGKYQDLIRGSLDEQMFRYNNRATKDNPLTDADRFTLALSQVANKRLTYAELTGKLERPEA